MKTAKPGLDLIREKEGLKLTPYNDQAGHATIGIGHLIHHGGYTAQDVAQWKGFTEEKAWDLFRKDIMRYETAVNESVKVPLNQYQFDALVSLCYNIGVSAFKSSTLVKKLNARDYKGAAEQFAVWNKVTINGKKQVSEGLTKRRNAEVTLFRKGGEPVVELRDDLLIVTEPMFFINVRTDLALDADGSSQGNGTKVLQFPFHKGANQQWRFDSVEGPGIGAGEVRIISESHKLVLDVENGSHDDGAKIQLWSWHGGANQRWIFKGMGDGLWTIINVGSGKAIDVPSGTIDPVQLQQWSLVDSENQVFSAIYVHAVPPPKTQSHNLATDLKHLGFSHGDTTDVKAFQQGFSFWDLAVDGNAGDETLKALAFSLGQNGKVGKHFLWTEFRSKGNGRIKTHRQLIRRLDALRNEVGQIPIISGYRDPAHNRRVGGATSSQHLKATACDVPGVCTSAVAKKHGFSGIGVTQRTGRVAHLDVRAEGGSNTTGAKVGAPTVWMYN